MITKMPVMGKQIFVILSKKIPHFVWEIFLVVCCRLVAATVAFNECDAALV